MLSGPPNWCQLQGQHVIDADAIRQVSAGHPVADVFAIHEIKNSCVPFFFLFLPTGTLVTG
jgi:hypothetical protein